MTTKTTAPAIRFFWNGLKVAGSPALIGAHFSYSDDYTVFAGPYSGKVLREIPEHLTVYFTSYDDLPAAVVEALPVENNSDGMTDYFEKSRAMITRSHPLWSAVLAAYVAQCERAVKRCEARAAKRPGYQSQVDDARARLAAAKAVR